MQAMTPKSDLSSRQPVETFSLVGDAYVWRTDILGAITAGYRCARCGGGRKLSVFTVGRPDVAVPMWWADHEFFCSHRCWRAATEPPGRQRQPVGRPGGCWNTRAPGPDRPEEAAMSIVPTQPAPDDAGAEHPPWCARQHPAKWPVHEAQVGVDLELSGDLAFAVLVQNVHGDHVTEVVLVRRDRERATVTRLSIVEAGIMRDLFAEALQLVAGQPAE